MKRELIIDLETSALTPEKGEIVRFYAVNRWDDEDEFDEWVKPLPPLSHESQKIIGTTNEQLANCRPIKVALADFMHFIDRAELFGIRLNSDLEFLEEAYKRPME